MGELGIKKDRLLIAAISFGDYDKYIPYFIYSVLTSYPEADVLIYCDGEPDEPIKKALKLLGSRWPQKFKVDTKYFDSFSHLEKADIVGGGKKVARWIIAEEEFAGYDYVYFTDVDFIILPEEPSLLEYHRNRAVRFSLPFSNAVRQDSNAMKRLTGLHFIDVKAYYGLLGDLINKLRKDKDEFARFISDCKRDEQFLHKLVSSKIDLTELQHAEYIRPWHGIHLGAGRGAIYSDKKFLANSSLSKAVCRTHLAAYFQDPLFQDVVKLVPEKTVENCAVYLGVNHGDSMKYYMGRVKLMISNMRNS